MHRWSALPDDGSLGPKAFVTWMSTLETDDIFRWTHRPWQSPFMRFGRQSACRRGEQILHHHIIRTTTGMVMFLGMHGHLQIIWLEYWLSCAHCIPVGSLNLDTFSPDGDTLSLAYQWSLRGSTPVRNQGCDNFRVRGFGDVWPKSTEIPGS